MSKITDLVAQIKENAMYVCSFLLIIVALFVISALAERIIRSKKGITDKTSAARRAASVGLLSAISAVLMLFEIPMPFAPFFYKLDLSELPVMIGAFAFGPSAGVLIEFIKIILKLMRGTTTAFVGELANFTVGASFVIPAATLYYANRTKKTAFLSCILGTVCITIFGTVFNAVYLLPAFAKLYGMPLEAILALGAEVNPLAGENNIVTFVIACVAPLNFLKGTVVSFFTLLIYKKISPILKGAGIGANLVKKKEKVSEE